jgi:hypothetical protein
VVLDLFPATLLNHLLRTIHRHELGAWGCNGVPWRKPTPKKFPRIARTGSDLAYGNCRESPRRLPTIASSTNCDFCPAGTVSTFSPESEVPEDTRQLKSSAVQPIEEKQDKMESKMKNKTYSVHLVIWFLFVALSAFVLWLVAAGHAPLLARILYWF